jgi:hypothetical protein
LRNCWKPGRGLRRRSFFGGTRWCVAHIGGCPRIREWRALGRRTRALSSPGHGGSCAPRSFRASSRSLRTIPNTAWRIVAWPRARGLAASFGNSSRQGGSGRTPRSTAVPRHARWGRPTEAAAGDRRSRQGWLESRVCGAEDRAALHVKREADGLPGVAARHELPRISTSSYLESKRRLSSGCSSVITTVATGARSRKLVWSIDRACQRS